MQPVSSKLLFHSVIDHSLTYDSRVAQSAVHVAKSTKSQPIPCQKSRNREDA